jgi:hypothetical protein
MSQRRHVPPKCQLTFSGLHGVTSQKTEYFLIRTDPQAVGKNTRKTECRSILFGNSCVCTLDISKLEQMPTEEYYLLGCNTCNSVEVCQCFRGTSVTSNQTILHYNPEVAAVRTSNPTEVTTVIHFM